MIQQILNYLSILFIINSYKNQYQMDMDLSTKIVQFQQWKITLHKKDISITFTAHSTVKDQIIELQLYDVPQNMIILFESIHELWSIIVASNCFKIQNRTLIIVFIFNNKKKQLRFNLVKVNLELKQVVSNLQAKIEAQQKIIKQLQQKCKFEEANVQLWMHKYYDLDKIFKQKQIQLSIQKLKQQKQIFKRQMQNWQFSKKQNIFENYQKQQNQKVNNPVNAQQQKINNNIFAGNEISESSKQSNDIFNPKKDNSIFSNPMPSSNSRQIKKVKRPIIRIS